MSQFRIGIVGDYRYQGKLIFQYNMSSITSSLDLTEVSIILLTEVDNHPLCELCRTWSKEFETKSVWYTDVASFIKSGIDILLVFGSYELPIDLEMYCLDNHISIQEIAVDVSTENELEQKERLAKKEFEDRMQLNQVNIKHSPPSVVINDDSPLPAEVLNEIANSYREQITNDPNADMTKAAMNFFDSMAQQYESSYGVRVGKPK
jgi:hypothetical protein